MTSVDAERPLFRNNKLRNLGILFFDLLSIGVLWLGYDNLQRIFMETNNHVDILRIGNRDGFFIAGIVVPFLHLLVVIEQLFPDFIDKIQRYKKPVNNCVMGFIFAVLFAGFFISSWLQTRAEDAGYVHCRYISGVSALAKTLVYTKGAELCRDLSAKARAERTRR